GRARARLRLRRKRLGLRQPAFGGGAGARPAARAPRLRAPRLSRAARAVAGRGAAPRLELGRADLGPAKEPRTVAAAALVYCVGTLLGAAVYGAEAWLGNAELFTVFARAFA